MLSRTKKQLTDPIKLTLAHYNAIKGVSRRYLLNPNYVELLLVIHCIQRIYNTYVDKESVLLFRGYQLVAFYNGVKVLVKSGFLGKIANNLYNVEPHGLSLVRSYETNISRAYSELEYKHRKEWKYIPLNHSGQKRMKQYPVKVVENVAITVNGLRNYKCFIYNAKTNSFIDKSRRLEVLVSGWSVNMLLSDGSSVKIRDIKTIKDLVCIYEAVTGKVFK